MTFKTNSARISAKQDAEAFAFGLFDNVDLIREVNKSSKPNLRLIWSAVREMTNWESVETAKLMAPIQVHFRLVDGLPVEAMFLAGSMAFDSLDECERFFSFNRKKAPQVIGARLAPENGERALRIARTLMYAKSVLGDVDSARQYLKTPNFALGGMTPRELLQTFEGEQFVIEELQTYADGGPV